MTTANQPQSDPIVRKQSLTISTLWLMTAKGAGFLLGIAVPFLIARKLDKVGMGHYKQIFQLLATASALLPFGFAMTAFYFFPREKERRAAICLNIVLVCGGIGLLAGLILFFDPGLMPWMFGEPPLLAYSREVALLFPLYVLSSLLETFPVVLQEFRLAGVFIIGSQLSRASLLFVAAFVYGTVNAIVIAAIIHAALQTLVLIGYLELRLPRFWRTFEWPLLRKQLSYQAPFALAGMLYVLQTDLPDFTVSRKFGAAIFAIYAVGCTDLPLIGILLESASSVMIGRISELRVNNDTAEIIALTARVARKLALVFFAIYALLIVVGKDLITFLYTDKYLGSWPIFAVNCLILLMFPILFDPIARTYPAQMALFNKVRIGLFIAMVAALWFFVGRFGPVSAIIIVVCRLAIENIFSCFYYGRILGMKRADLRQFSPLLRIGVCSAAAGSITFVVRRGIVVFAHGLGLHGWREPLTVLVLCGTVFCIIYGAALLAMRVPTSEERQQAVRTLTRYIPLVRT